MKATFVKNIKLYKSSNSYSSVSGTPSRDYVEFKNHIFQDRMKFNQNYKWGSKYPYATFTSELDGRRHYIAYDNFEDIFQHSVNGVTEGYLFYISIRGCGRNRFTFFSKENPE